MTTRQASIRTESGTVIRTTRGRRRPVVQASPFAVCPVCGCGDFADNIAAGDCTGCRRIVAQADRERAALVAHYAALAAERRDEPANSEECPY